MLESKFFHVGAKVQDIYLHLAPNQKKIRFILLFRKLFVVLRTTNKKGELK